MSLKILTVDDSKAVRIIIRKAFTNYDVTIIEAANGVEGLAAASKEIPDLILLDVTMPVMDGVEMLTKLKSDAALKAMPVIMLTAEAGRENVLKIAKIGIRDYIVKPFKDDVLIEKVGRVVELRPAAKEDMKQKTITDHCSFLVVDDKPAIIKQLQDGFAKSAWEIKGCQSTGEAIDHCQHKLPDLIIISLSLPEDGALTLFRLLRSTPKTKYVPIFGLSVRTATAEQEAAQKAGFTSIVTKPIDFEEVESKIAKTLKLDISPRYFQMDGNCLIIRFPQNLSSIVLHEIEYYLTPKIAEAVDAGMSRVIFDIHEIKTVEMETIKLLLHAMQLCSDLTLLYAMVGSIDLAGKCQAFEESKNWTFFNTLEEAKNNAVNV